MDTTVSLDDEQAQSIAAGVAAGRYASSSDVVLAALRLLERAETEDVGKLRFLREGWQEGIDSGDAGARMLVVERWLALYRAADDHVQAVRIIDGARDLTRLDWPRGRG